MGLSKLWSEFKAFAFQGNMIELAVAVVIGGAFGGVVHSLVGDIIMPTIVFVIHEGEVAASTAKNAAETVAAKAGLPTSQPATEPTTQAVVATDNKTTTTTADKTTTTTAAPADPQKPISIDFNIGPVPVGKFLTELINFIILAFAVFIMIVKLLGGVMKKMSTPEVPGEPTTRECPECLSIIPIKAKRCSHCTAEVPPVSPVIAPV